MVDLVQSPTPELLYPFKLLGLGRIQLRIISHPNPASDGRQIDENHSPGYIGEDWLWAFYRFVGVAESPEFEGVDAEKDSE